MALCLALALALAGLAVHPGVRATAKAAAVLDDAVGGPLPRPWALSVRRDEQVAGGVTFDRYSSRAGAPQIVLVPGATPAGRDDARVVALASSLAGAGREVLVPELRLYRQELAVEDLGRLVSVVARSCRAGDTDPGLVLLGISYGGALALLAAADERVSACVGLVATFGAYGDLVGVLQAAVTGVSVVGGRAYPWEAADRVVVRTVLRDAAEKLVPSDQRGPLRRALDRRDPVGLSGAADLVYRLMTADEPGTVADLARRLPPPGRELVDTFSPVAVAGEVEADVLLVHAADDPAVPVAELRRLHRAFPDAEARTVRSFTHVDLSAGGDPVALGRDLLTAWSFLRAVLRAQEEWPWS